MSFVISIKRLVKKFYNGNEAFNRRLRKQGAIIGNGVQIVDRFNFLYEPWFANLIEIQDGVVLAAGVRIVSHDSSYANVFSNLPIKFGRVIIKNNAYIGVNSIILPGVSIGEYSLIGAGSLVNKNVPPYSIAVGNPAKIIGDSRDGLSRFKTRLNMHQETGIFYLDMGGSDREMRDKYGANYEMEILRRYKEYFSESKNQ